MQAVVYHGPKDFRFESVPKPEIEEPTDAILRVVRTTICGSDLHLWNGGLPAAEQGFAVGHEFVGVLEQVGSAVSTLGPGDRALASCTLGCGSCARCRRSLYSGCSVTTAGGTRSNILGFSTAYPGGQAEFVRIPFAETNVFQIPEGVSDEQALFLTDILPTANMACEMATVSPGDSVVVFGCGPVGSLAQQLALIRGAAQVIALDLDEARLEAARRRGCLTIHPGRENVIERVLELTGGEGAAAMIEAVGRPELVSQAGLYLRPGGTVAVAGVIVSNIDLPWALFLMKNLSLRGGLVNPQRHIARLLPLIQSGRLDPSALITHRMPLAQALDAYDLFAERRDGVLKIVLEP